MIFIDQMLSYYSDDHEYQKLLDGDTKPSSDTLTMNKKKVAINIIALAMVLAFNVLYLHSLGT